MKLTNCCKSGVVLAALLLGTSLAAQQVRTLEYHCHWSDWDVENCQPTRARLLRDTSFDNWMAFPTLAAKHMACHVSEVVVDGKPKWESRIEASDGKGEIIYRRWLGSRSKRMEALKDCDTWLKEANKRILNAQKEKHQ